MLIIEEIHVYNVLVVFLFFQILLSHKKNQFPTCQQHLILQQGKDAHKTETFWYHLETVWHLLLG